ncbi:MAG: trimethylamine methyltransferase family protein [Deltaproteobacteria bacterium]|jgi:trimethylamine--corrinoid protein Co-methyltransferase|nr:trimethylamine methyltransferase family protein [Deltaproteobacteria bacterium]
MRLTVEALTPVEVENIHGLTVEILGSGGLSFNSPEALEIFKKRGCKVDGARVTFTPAEIEEALKSAPQEFKMVSRNPARALDVGPGHPPALLAASGVPMIIGEAGDKLPVDFDDYKNMLRLTQTSPVLNMANSGALYPTHADPETALRLQIYLTLVMTDMPLVAQTEGTRLSKLSLDMARAAAGTDDPDRPVVAGICNSLSPMAWDARMLEGIKSYAELGQPLNISCCAMCGATAPVFLSGAVLEANCEVLGGIIYSQLVRPGAPVVYGTTSSVMDMASMGLSLGTPEYSLVSAGCAAMARRYRLPYRSGGGLTDSKSLDAQAGLESAWNILLSLASGVNFMLQSVGVLESYMSAGFDKWVFDEEIILRARRMLGGLGEIPAGLPETIAEGVAEGGFLKLKSTLKNFRKQFYRPTLGDRRSFDARRDAGTTIRDDAWAVVKRRLREYELPGLDKTAKKELDRLFAEAAGCPPPTVE